MKVLLFIWSLFKRFPRLFILNVFLSTCVAVIGAASIVSLAPVVDIILKSDIKSTSPITQHSARVLQWLGLPVSITTFLLLFLLTVILKNAFTILARHLIFRARFSVTKNLIIGTYTAFFRARWHFFASGNQGQLINTLTRETYIAGDAFAIMGNLFSDTLCMLCYFAVPFVICWQITLLCAILALIFLIPLQALGKINYGLGQKTTAASIRVMSMIHETLGAVKLILGFGNQQKSMSEINKNLDEFRSAAVKSQTLISATSLLYEPIGAGIVVLGFYCAYRYYAIPISEVLIMFYSLRMCMPLLGMITSNKNNLANYLPSYEQVKQLQDLAHQQIQKSGVKPFMQLETEIAFRNVTFGYPDHEPILHEFTITIPKGQMIAFVGDSGVGKTTILDLIIGFYEPNSGEVLVNGVPLSAYDIYSFRNTIGFVPQDSILFNTTVRDNLLWGKADASQDEIEKACKLANAHEFIIQLPKGYNTVVGDRGIRLSGGQRQRIALARAIVRKPELLILDEATSSLDSQSELLIQQAINKIAEETTTVIVAHRLSTIARANYIYVIQQGRIAEHGTYTELINKDGIFKHMVNLQSLQHI